MTTEDLMNKNIIPVIKWVGGKRQLLPILKEYIPTKFNKYYEPFFGGGALFFYLKPKKAVINDSNIQLMSMYQNLCNYCDEIKSLLDMYQNKYNSLSKGEQLNFYYSLRNKYNQKISAQLNDAETASLLIFLNKSGFNGLYRVNELLPYKWGSFCEHPACRILFENIHSDLRPACRAGRLRHRYLVWRQDY